MDTASSRDSMTDIAEATGISLSHVSRIFSGERNPSIDTATKLADYLGITIDELLSRCRKRDENQAA